MRKKKKQKKQRPRPSGTLSLSLCMIARDEADFLDRCLASVKGLVDEIVVVEVNLAEIETGKQSRPDSGT